MIYIVLYFVIYPATNANIFLKKLAWYMYVKAYSISLNKN